MYAKFRDALTTNILQNCPQLDVATLNTVLQQVDLTATDFDFSEKNKDIILYGDGDVPHVLKMYIAAKAVEGQSKGTQENSLLICSKLFQAVRKPVDQITANDIRVFLYNYQKERGIETITADKYRMHICAFFHWCTAEGYIDKDPAATIKPMKFEKKQRVSLSQLELEYLRNACTDAREHALVEFLYSTGCRASELCNVKLSDVDFKTGEVHLYGKGKKHRTSFINAKCHVALAEYLCTRNDDCEYLFIRERIPHVQLTTAGMRAMLSSIVQRSGIEKTVSPHILRHTTATQAVQHGMPVEQVRRLLGHENIATTMIYVETSVQQVHESHTRAIV